MAFWQVKLAACVRSARTAFADRKRHAKIILPIKGFLMEIFIGSDAILWVKCIKRTAQRNNLAMWTGGNNFLQKLNCHKSPRHKRKMLCMFLLRAFGPCGHPVFGANREEILIVISTELKVLWVRSWTIKGSVENTSRVYGGNLEGPEVKNWSSVAN